MKKFILLGLLFLSVGIVFSGCSVKQTAKNTVNRKINEEKAKIQNKIEKTVEKGKKKISKIEDIANLGKPQKCTFSNVNSKVKGVIYTDGKGDTYGEFTVDQPDGKLTKMITISTKDKTYIWSPTTKKGSVVTNKIKDESKETVAESNEAVSGKNQATDYLKETMADYKCGVWLVNPAKFKPPLDIRFTDLDAMMKKARMNLSKACNSLSGQAKTNCLRQLSP